MAQDIYCDPVAEVLGISLRDSENLNGLKTLSKMPRTGRRKRKSSSRTPASKLRKTGSSSATSFNDAAGCSEMQAGENVQSAGNGSMEAGKPAAQPAPLSPAVLDSLQSLAVVPEPASDSSSFPLYHPYSVYGKQEASKIHRSRQLALQEGAGEDASKGPEDLAVVEGRGERYALAGVLDLQLEGALDLRGVLGEGQQAVNLGLVVRKVDDDGQWCLRVSVGDWTWFFKIKMDQRFHEHSVLVMEHWLTVLSPLFKFFLPHRPGDAARDAVQVEVWAVEKICNFDRPSDTASKMPVPCGHTNATISKCLGMLVSTLYPQLDLNEMSEFKNNDVWAMFVSMQAVLKENSCCKHFLLCISLSSRTCCCQWQCGGSDTGVLQEHPREDGQRGPPQPAGAAPGPGCHPEGLPEAGRGLDAGEGDPSDGDRHWDAPPAVEEDLSSKPPACSQLHPDVL